MMFVGSKANHILPIPVDGRHVPGNFGLQFWKLVKDKIDYRPEGFAFVGSSEAKYSSTELNFGDFISFRLPLMDRFFIEHVQAITFVARESPTKPSVR